MVAAGHEKLNAVVLRSARLRVYSRMEHRIYSLPFSDVSQRIWIMFRTIALALAVAGGSALVLTEPADARSGKSKAKPSQKAAAYRGYARVSKRDNTGQAVPGRIELRDRTTFYFPNGRLNGQELFDSIADRAGNAGE